MTEPGQPWNDGSKVSLEEKESSIQLQLDTDMHQMKRDVEADLKLQKVLAKRMRLKVRWTVHSNVGSRLYALQLL